MLQLKWRVNREFWVWFSFSSDKCPEVELLDYMVIIFSFLRKLCIFFHSCGTNLHFCQQCISSLLSPHPRRHLSLPIFFTIAILTDVMCCLIVVLICISLVISDVKFLFIYYPYVGHLYVFFGKKLVEE